MEKNATGFVRNLADIVMLVAFSFGVVFALQALLAGRSEDPGVILMFAVPIASLVFMWILLCLRGQRLADIGLGRFGNPATTVLFGIAIAAALWGVAAVTEAAGFVRNFDSIRNDLEGADTTYLAIMVAFAFIGPGLYEEATFRGFVLHRIAHMFGASGFAWFAAALLQGVLFGLSHGHQGLYGMLYTGGLSALLAFVFLATGRNLWPLIIGHGLYDASRFVYFYGQWNSGA